MAARDADDEKFAAAMARRVVEGTATRGRREATSLAIDCGEAIVEIVVAGGGERGRRLDRGEIARNR